MILRMAVVLSPGNLLFLLSFAKTLFLPYEWATSHVTFEDALLPLNWRVTS